MRKSREHELELGADVLDKLLPFRRPFRFIDRVTAYRYDPKHPEILAYRHIATNEQVFDGHFPSFHLWPGIYIVEGLGQTATAMMTIYALQRGWSDQGGDARDVLAWLRNLELGTRSHPGYRPDKHEDLQAWIETQSPGLYVTASVEMKFLQSVFPGDRLDYDVRLEHLVGNAVRSAVTARVGSDTVATGAITGAALARAIDSTT